MDTQNYIEYEMVEPISNRHLVSESREEAIAYFEKRWMIYEHHITVSQHSKFTQSQLTVTILWNDNPELQEG